MEVVLLGWSRISVFFFWRIKSIYKKFKIFLCFSNYFDMLILKIILKNIILIYI
jgi:hypothetical protein